MNGWQSKFISGYVDIILKTPVKILIVITSFTNLGISIYGATQLEANFDPFMFNANYEVAKMKINIEKYFPSVSPSVTRGNFLLKFLKGHINRFLQDKYDQDLNTIQHQIEKQKIEHDLINQKLIIQMTSGCFTFVRAGVWVPVGISV